MPPPVHATTRHGENSLTHSLTCSLLHPTHLTYSLSDYAKALRRGPEETTASTAAAPVPAATPTAPTATPASSVGAAHAHAPSPSEEEAPKKKKSENGSLEDASNEPTRAGPRTGDRRSNVAETHCGADDDGATLTFGVFSAVPAVPGTLTLFPLSVFWTSTSH